MTSRGYRLFPGDTTKTKIVFIQSGVEIPTRATGGSSVTNDELNGQQTLQVVVPK